MKGLAPMFSPHLSCRWAAPADGPNAAAWWTSWWTAGEVMWTWSRTSSAWGKDGGAWGAPGWTRTGGAFRWPGNVTISMLDSDGDQRTAPLTLHLKEEAEPKCEVYRLFGSGGTSWNSLHRKSLTWLKLINNVLVSPSLFPWQRCTLAKQPSNYKTLITL